MNFFKILSIIGLISSWMKKALADGKVTLREALELLELLAAQLGIPLDFDIALVIVAPAPEKEAAITPDEDVVLESRLAHPHLPIE